MMSASRRPGRVHRNRKHPFIKREVHIDQSLADGSPRSLNRLFRNFYHVRASHMGKPPHYWLKGQQSKLVKLLTRAALSMAMKGTT